MLEFHLQIPQPEFRINQAVRYRDGVLRGWRRCVVADRYYDGSSWKYLPADDDMRFPWCFADDLWEGWE